MHEYYFKIKKGDIEFECSTSDKITFEEQLSDWINGIVQGTYVEPPVQNNKDAGNEAATEQPQRSGFIDVKNLVSINDMQTPPLSANFDFGEEKHDEIPQHEMKFEDALQESLENPKTEVIEKQEQISDFEDYIKTFNPENQMDYLVVTAMYILNIENNERFSIKQLNAKLVPFTGKPVDHALMQEAIEQNYIRIVPDLTETSEFTEYTLTQDGEGYFVI